MAAGQRVGARQLDRGLDGLRAARRQVDLGVLVGRGSESTSSAAASSMAAVVNCAPCTYARRELARGGLDNLRRPCPTLIVSAPPQASSQRLPSSASIPGAGRAFRDSIGALEIPVRRRNCPDTGGWGLLWGTRSCRGARFQQEAGEVPDGWQQHVRGRRPEHRLVTEVAHDGGGQRAPRSFPWRRLPARSPNIERVPRIHPEPGKARRSPSGWGFLRRVSSKATRTPKRSASPNRSRSA